MTAIVALYDPTTRSGVMAADSAMTGFVNLQAPSKILFLNNYWVGTSGSTVGRAFITQEGPWLCIEGEGGVRPYYGKAGDLQQFAFRWRTWCTERGHTEVVQGVTEYPAHFIFLGPGGIYEITNDGEVFAHVETAIAIGIGGQVCLGAVHALRTLLPQPTDREPLAIYQQAVATAAIEASAKYCDGCALPVVVQPLV